MAGRKSTNVEIHHRVSAVYGLLTKGKSTTDIQLYAASEWNLSPRQTDTYLQRARAMLERDAELTRPAWLAEALGRLRRYEENAYERGQLSTAISSVITQAKLIGFEL